MSKVSIWLHLGNVPLELFTRKGLNYISSAIGNPLYMDIVTAERKKMAYAKVCVEIDVTRKIPRYITVNLGSNCKTLVVVETFWLPAKLDQCCVFGHSEKNCPNRKIAQKFQVWIPKQQGVKTEVAGPKNQGKSFQGRTGYDARFSMLKADDKAFTSTIIQQPAIVADPMENIKAKVRDGLAMVDKGKGMLVANERDVEVQDIESL
ncbi:hypothetical protein PTKIN_Ptkin04bG0119100 [Pterospermum kingtungense]